MREEDDIKDEQVHNIDREKVLLAPERISMVTDYIIEHFSQKTKRNHESYNFNKLVNIDKIVGRNMQNAPAEQRQQVRLKGFNSIFAVSSIDAAKLYYKEFKKRMELLPSDKRLKIATIFSYGANEAVDDDMGWIDDENSDDTEGLDKSSRDFLESAISDYNDMFKTSFDASAERFQNYYKDVSLRMKNREIDLLIVVNMFLTGFDATTLNTLWVDKNLRMHGLLQAYSRTNRILNSVKTFGNIVCFRDLEAATNESIALFGDKEAGGIVLLRTFGDYYYGYDDDKGKHHEGYKELIDKIVKSYPIGTRILGEEAEKKFIKLYGSILKSTNLLSSFDQFEGNEILDPRQLQDYQSIYLNLYDKYRPEKGESVNVNDDIVFEMELIKQVEINIDYILSLIEKYHDDNTADKELLLTDIKKAVDSSPSLRDKKELIEDFIASLTPEKNVSEDWAEYVRMQRREQLDAIIAEENLKREKTYEFMNDAFKDGGIRESGTALAEILPPISLFSKDRKRDSKKKAVLERLKAFFERFFDISTGEI